MKYYIIKHKLNDDCWKVVAEFPEYDEASFVLEHYIDNADYNDSYKIVRHHV